MVSRFRARSMPLLAIAALLWFVAWSLPCEAASPSRRWVRPVFLVIADHLSLEELNASGPEARALLSRSAVALMNTGLGHGPSRPGLTMEERHLALGAGVRLSGSDGLIQALREDEIYQGQRASERWALETGLRAQQGSMVCIGLPRVRKASRSLSPGGECLGSLGDAFRMRGLRTAVLGCGDTPETRTRWAPLLVMDSHGFIDYSLVGSAAVTVTADSASGWIDDQNAILAAARGCAGSYGLIAIELGDLARTEASKAEISDTAYGVYRSAALRRLSGFLGRMRRLVDDTGGALVFAAPVRSEADGSRSDLTPTFLYEGSGRAGLLLSATTRTPGLISNIDICPTVASVAGVEPEASIVGTAASPAPGPGMIDDLFRMERIASRSYRLQTPVLVTVGVLVILAVTVLEALLFLRIGGARVRRAFGYALLWMLALPLTFLLTDPMAVAAPVYAVCLVGVSVCLTLTSIVQASALADRSDKAALAASVVLWALLPAIIAEAGSRGGGMFLATAGVGMLVALVARPLRSRPLRPSVAAAGATLLLTSVCLVIDVLQGAHMVRWTILSCDHITGIRYYGLGNEYMGVLVGAALLGPLLVIRSMGGDARWTRIGRSAQVAIIGAWFALVTVIVGYAGLGANVGGLITCVAGFGAALILLLRERLRPFHGVLLALVTAGLVILFASLDLSGSAERHSHLANSIARAETYGWQTFAALVWRKLSMHMGILRLPQAYLPALFSIPFLVMYGGRLRQEMASHRDDILYRVGLPATLVGAGAAFAFNDSGVVPAALIIAIFVTVALLARLSEAEA